MPEVQNSNAAESVINASVLIPKLLPPCATNRASRKRVAAVNGLPDKEILRVTEADA